MGNISIRISENDKKLFRDYAKANNISLSELIRTTLLEKIKDDIDLKLYNIALEDHNDNPKDISFEEMFSELNFNE